LDKIWEMTAGQVKSLAKVRRICGPQNISSAFNTQFFDYNSVSDDFKSDDVLILHKGRVAELDRTYLALALMLGHVCFANEVFIVIAGESIQSPELTQDVLKHIRSLGNALVRPEENNVVNVTARNSGSYLGKGVILSTLYNNQKIFLDGDDISLTPHLMIDGHWERWITDAFLGRIHSGMSVLDIGANCGYYTLLAAKAVGKSGSITAIDANPRMCELVQKSVSVNGYTDYTRVINAAVMEKSGHIKFAIPKKFKGSATYLREDMDFSKHHETYDIIEVQGKALGDLTGDRKFDVVKIDAEGAEPLIYKGARDFLRKMPGIEIFMEFTPGLFGEHISGAEFIDLLDGDGFELSIVTHDGLIKPASRDQLLSGDNPDIFLKLRQS
jgi:FkbM family methyltransferase